MASYIEIKSIVEKLCNEYAGIIPLNFIDSWFACNNLTLRPVYKKLSFGYIRKGNSDYDLVIKTYTRNGKTNRLAKEIISKIGFGYVERNLFGAKRPTLLSNARISHSNKIAIGNGIKKKHGGAGTIGAFVKDNKQKMHLLTCGHVMKNRLIKSDEVFISKCNLLFRDKGLKVGNVVHCVHPKRGIKNIIDASIISIDSNQENYQNIAHQHPVFKDCQIKLLPEDFEISLNEPVFKIGSKVKFGYGTFAGKFNDIDINGYVFDELFAINEKVMPFSLAGDSGSIVFIERDSELFAIGIVVASGFIEVRKGICQTQIYVCPLNKILTHFDFSYS